MGSNNGVYQLFKDARLLQFDGEDPIALYEYEKDPMLRENLIGKIDCQENLRLLKSFIQQYMERMNSRDGLRYE